MSYLRHGIEVMFLFAAGVSYLQFEYEGALVLLVLTIYVHLLRRESEGR